MTILLKHWKPILVVVALVTMTLLAHTDGKLGERKKWELKETQRISQETKKALLASEAARKKEHEYANNLAKIDQEGLDKIKELNNEASNTIAALKRDNVRLSVSIKNGNRGTCSEGTSTSMDNGETRAELSDEAFEFLAGEASRADRAVVQLTACQKIIELQ